LEGSPALGKRARDNMALTKKIREIHTRSCRTYAYPRVHAELKAIGVRCSRKRVARLMRKEGLQVIASRGKDSMATLPLPVTFVSPRYAVAGAPMPCVFDTNLTPMQAGSHASG
jgi:transposase InsO family protein